MFSEYAIYSLFGWLAGFYLDSFVAAAAAAAAVVRLLNMMVSVEMMKYWC